MGEEGYEGILGSKGKITKDYKYQQIADFSGEKGPTPVINAIRVISLMLLIFMFFLAIIIINIRKTKESQLSVLFRILANYLQLITSSLAMSSNYPETFSTFLMPIERIGGSSDTFLSFDCFITDYEIKGAFYSNKIFKLFMLAILPIILSLIVALIWVVLYTISKNIVKDLTKDLAISFISIVFLLHPKLTEESINAFRCVQIDYNLFAARIDLDLECYSFQHLKWGFLIAFPILIIWVISLPTAALILLFKNIKKGEDNKVKEYLLILYQGLKPNRFYWEFVNTLRKIAILSSFLFVNPYKILIATCTLLVSGRIQLFLNPYKREENNNVEFLAIIIGTFTLLSTLIYIEEDRVANLNHFVTIWAMILNIFFLLNWFKLLFKIYEDKSNKIRTVSFMKGGIYRL